MLLSHFSRVRLCATPETAAHQAPPSMGVSRQEYWSGVPLPSPHCIKYIMKSKKEKKFLRRKLLASYIIKLGSMGLTIVKTQSAFENMINYN